MDCLLQLTGGTHTCLSDNLRSMGFKPMRFDPDAWLRLREDKSGYDYIGTHTDDLMIVAEDASHHMRVPSGTSIL
jgi:hypothetical protein